MFENLRKLLMRQCILCVTLFFLCACGRYDDEEEQIVRYQCIFLEDVEKLEIGNIFTKLPVNSKPVQK